MNNCLRCGYSLTYEIYKVKGACTNGKCPDYSKYWKPAEKISGLQGFDKIEVNE